MLTGKQVDSKKAKRMGLVDEVVPEAILIDVSAKLALKRAAEMEHKKAPAWKRMFKKEEISELLLADNPLGRKILFDQARKRAFSKTQGNYPAVDKILDVVKLGLAKGMERGLEAEAEAFGELVVSPEARSLMSIFFAITELKKDPGHDVANVEAKSVKKVGILGAGLMGAGVAYITAAQAKLPVRLKDRDAASLAKGLRYAREILDERVKRRRLTPTELDQLMARITAATDYSGFHDVDVVVEAVFEDLDLKRRMVSDIEEHAHKQTIFASNTSSLPIGKIAEGARRPEQIIGMHYFSPVHKMPLLEIIVTPQTAPWVIQACVELGKKQGKTVIVVRDGAGFYTTRILGPYMNEASFLLAEGVAIEKIDRALVKWGFPVGPITLLDEVGIDVGAKVAHVLHDAFGDRMAPPPGIERLLGDQRLGKKNQRGFYVYSAEKGKKQDKQVDASVYTLFGIEPNADPPSSDIAQRCALQMVNEAAYCFGDGILRSARDGDIGAIFGLGFPPFRGGPFRYIDAVGASEIVRRLENYRDQHGKRFTPAPVLLEMAKSGSTFHGEQRVPAGRHVREEASRPSVGSV
jgi:3-hydroxyacyl-CoA dehydrogenase/enoyl-CoA hydratase/3-hydroxybutyryl-CoA epimerase